MSRSQHAGQANHIGRTGVRLRPQDVDAKETRPLGLELNFSRLYTVRKPGVDTLVQPDRSHSPVMAASAGSSRALDKTRHMLKIIAMTDVAPDKVSMLGSNSYSEHGREALCHRNRSDL